MEARAAERRAGDKQRDKAGSKDEDEQGEHEEKTPRVRMRTKCAYSAYCEKKWQRTAVTQVPAKLWAYMGVLLTLYVIRPHQGLSITTFRMPSTLHCAKAAKVKAKKVKQGTGEDDWGRYAR